MDRNQVLLKKYKNYIKLNLIEVEEGQDPIVFVPKNLAEADFKNDVTIFSAVNAETPVFILHQVGELAVYRDIFAKLAE